MWLVIAVLLVIIEVVAVLGMLGPEYSDVETVDFFIMGIPAIVGIVNLVNAKKKAAELGAETEEELRAEKSRLLDEIEDLGDAEEPSCGMLAYTGKNWDLSTFRGTPAEVAALEKDFVELLISLYHTATRPNHLFYHWLVENELRAWKATLTGDKKLEEQFKQGTQAMLDSGSWILQILNAARTSIAAQLSTAAMHKALGIKSEEITLSYYQVLENNGVRKAQTDDEKKIMSMIGVLAGVLRTINDMMS